MTEPNPLDCYIAWPNDVRRSLSTRRHNSATTVEVIRLQSFEYCQEFVNMCGALSPIALGATSGD